MNTLTWYIAGVIVFLVGVLVYMAQPIWPVRATDLRAGGDPRTGVDAARLRAHVQMLAETLSPRDYQHPENLERVAAYVRQEFERAGGKVSEQVYEFEVRSYRNVVLRLGPETKERIVVGAHYDTHGPLPGADDNASGVAALIELSHLLATTQLPITVELVAYTLEESPFFRSSQMGSAVHAASLKRQGAIIRAMFSLEMIGYFVDEEGSQVYPLPGLSLIYPNKGHFIAVVGRLGEASLVRKIKSAMANATSLPVYSINAPRAVPGVDFSDHAAYWAFGYPAVMITDTAFYRNPNYHTARDTPETLDYTRMAQVVSGVYAAVQLLSQ